MYVFVILVISHFGIEGRNLVLKIPLNGHFLLKWAYYTEQKKEETSHVTSMLLFSEPKCNAILMPSELKKSISQQKPQNQSLQIRLHPGGVKFYKRSFEIGSTYFAKLIDQYA